MPQSPRTWDPGNEPQSPRVRARLQSCRSIAINISRAFAPAVLCLPLFLAGCKPVGPDYSKPAFHAPDAYRETGASAVVAPENPAGGTWSPANPSDGMLRGKWWEVYTDPQLNALEERIATDNQSLRRATEIYLTARDQVAIARASLFPLVSGSISATRIDLSQNRPSASSTTHYNDFVVGGQASWEPDFWGRIHRTAEAARDSAQASAADLAVVDLSLHAELAADYFQLRGLDDETRLLASTVGTLANQLQLTEQRLAGGVSTEADVAQARTQLETVRAQLIDLGVARAQFEHAIATLTNQNASSFSLPSAPLTLDLPRIPLGVPSQLLERRPDIAAAERRAAAANEQIGIAQSAFYPDIPLGATFGYESVHSGVWLSGPSTFWSLGAKAAELLFDAGQRRAVNDQTRHAYEAQAAAYRSTVLAAFNGVEDQLSTLRILEQESSVEQQAVASAQHSFDLANTRYRGGVTSYLEVLTAETALLNNQRTLIGLRTRQFVSSVALVRALGGGWDFTQLPK
ncbi:MAG: efflux transporter outer membrane subunit [Terracidiphilus sp.]|nr:efflux transporter outer membrane subunit [Terracidiphilus sp.]